MSVGPCTAAKVGSGRCSLENDFGAQETAPKVRLTADGHLICKSSVPGYSLKLKKWSMLLLLKNFHGAHIVWWQYITLS